MKKRNAIGLGLAGIIVLTGIALILSAKILVESRLRAALIAQGFEDVTFTVQALGATGIHFTDISLGKKLPLSVDSLTLDYSVLELLQKQVRELTIDRLVFKKEKIETEAKNILLEFDQGQSGSWQGSWSVETVETKHTPVPLPPLAGKGNFTVTRGKIDAKGDFASADNTHSAAFTLHYDSDNAVASVLTITSAALPWKGGMVSTRNAVIQLAGDRESALTLTVKNVPLGDLLQGATGGKATATGAVSGTVPLRIAKDGSITFEAGNLSANDAGTIVLSPDAIPGDNQQVSLLREVLSDFRYRTLSMAVDSGKDEKLSMLLSLSGNNPNVYNGREIKLNVRLTGDVLNLLQQSVVPLADPKRLLEMNQ